VNVEKLLAECGSHGVKVLVVEGQIRARGTPEALARYTPVLRSHKPELLAYLTKKAAAATGDLVREFIAVDGMTPADAERVAAVSIPHRSAAEWLEMIRELDDLIGRYCTTYRLNEAAKQKIYAARCCQPLATIPETLRWFQNELAKVKA
jgi:hypothetical protein